MFQLIHCAWQLMNCCYGVQAQTAECLVVGEMATRHLCVVLNKVDLLPADMRPKLIAKAKKRLAQTLAATTFAGCPMVAVSAKPGGCTSPRKAVSVCQPFLHKSEGKWDCPYRKWKFQGAIRVARLCRDWTHCLWLCSRAMSSHVCNTGGGDGPGQAAVGVDALKEQLARMVPPCPRQQKGSFLFAVDHCFALRGQGTVLTGTVLSGAVQVRLLVSELKGCRNPN